MSLADYNHKINNNDFTFKVTLVSVAGNAYTRAHDIKPTAIKEFFIDDNFKNFYQQGYIIIDNTQDILERDLPNNSNSTTTADYYSIGTNDPSITSSVTNAGFIFRGEARDILRVDIMPKLDTTTVNDLGSDDAKKYFYLNYDFAIYDSEEIVGNEPGQKYKKLYFWDLYYQFMLEKNIVFSTANIVEKTPNITQAANTNNPIYAATNPILTELASVASPVLNTGTGLGPVVTPSIGTLGQTPAQMLPQNADNNDRSVTTGIALRELIKATFPANDNYPVTISVNTVTGTTNDQDPGNQDWDTGSTNIFFSTPANYKAIDCVKYILSRHVSVNNNYDQCFLRLTRSTREFTFKSLSQYFQQAFIPSSGNPGNFYLETIKIGGYTQQDGQTNYIPRYFTPQSGLYFDRIGNIKSFSFDNMAGIISQQKLVPTFVHSYDYENKQFNIDIERNGIEQAMKTYQQNYVNHMNSGNGEDPYSNFAPGQLRYLNKNIQNVFSVTEQDPDQRLAWGRNEFLYASVFTNNLISFKLPGSTHRQAGMFIGIDRDNSIPDSLLDNKLLGIYFIIEVKHIFTGNEYTNELHCIKVYNYKQLEDTYDNTNVDGNLIGLVSKGL